MRRASRGRLERPSSSRDVSGASGSALSVVVAGAAGAGGSEDGGVDGWPFARGEAILKSLNPRAQILPGRSPLSCDHVVL